MKRKRIRQLVEERIGFGYARQHVFDELVLEHPEVPPERVAKVVRYIPSLAAREHFRVPQQALLAAIVATGLIDLLVPLWSDDLSTMGTARMLRLLPIATVFLGFAVYRWRGEVLPWLAIINGFSAFAVVEDLSELAKGNVVTWDFAQHLLSLLIAVLAFYLSLRLYPKYTVVKDPLGRMPDRFVFPPEPGMMMM